jgi:hypothetical protein
MKWDDLKFRKPDNPEPEPLRPYASVSVSHRRGNSIALVTELSTERDGSYSLEFPFLRATEAMELLNAWETLVKKR